VVFIHKPKFHSKCARILVLGHYLFRGSEQFSERKTVSLAGGTDNVQGQVSMHIFAPNIAYCVYYPSNIFRNTRDLLKIGKNIT